MKYRQAWIRLKYIINFFQEHIMVTRIFKQKALSLESFGKDHQKYIQMNNDFYS